MSMTRRNSTNTRRVPVDQTMFASRPGGVTLIGPDDQVWQAKDTPPVLTHVTSAEASAKGVAPRLEAADFLNQIRPGTNRTLWQAIINEDGDAEWVLMSNPKADITMGFDLPKKTESDAILESSVVDDEGVILSQFVGSYASYCRMDAIRAYWNGIDFFTDDHKYLHTPESFKRGIPATMGLEGLIYIPREDNLEDLLIPLSAQESGFPAIYHPPSQAGVYGFNSSGQHKTTGRQIGNLDAAACWESAWNAAIFEVVDVYTEPEKTFEERRLLLDSTIKPLQSAYKQLRLLPINPILSKSWIQTAFETLPSNAALVLNDPSNPYEGATVARTEKPRRTFEKKEKGSPLVGWKLDGAGNLDTLIVEGTDHNKSAINVGEGDLWVNTPYVRTIAQYNAKMKMVEAKFKSFEAVKVTASGNTKVPTKAGSDTVRASTTAGSMTGDLYGGTVQTSTLAIPATAPDHTWVKKAIEAYKKDAELHASSQEKCSKDVSTKRLELCRSMFGEQRASEGESIEQAHARMSFREFIHPDPTNLQIPSGPLFGNKPKDSEQGFTTAATDITALGTEPLAKNLMSWSSNQRQNYQRTFPYGCLVSYKVKKGNRNEGQEDSYGMVRVTIV